MLGKLVSKFNKYPFPQCMTVFLRNILWQRLCISVCSPLVRFQLWLAGCPCGKPFRADGLPLIYTTRRGQISIGRHCRINSRFGSNLVGRSCRTILHASRGGQITFGDYSGCSFAIIASRASITIGRHVKIGGNVRIYDHDYHAVDYMQRRDYRTDQENEQKAPVVIGDDVFIGVNALILKGVTIGDRAIIGAGSVVAKDVPADEVWAGNPARFVKKLKVV